jgi:hypothetical protein
MFLCLFLFILFIFFIFFYSASEITELYSRFSKNLAPKQYQPEQHNDTTNEFCTHIAPESGDILTTHHINGLAKHAEAEADAVLREITVNLLHRDILKKSHDECIGCAVDHPSQKNHTCLLEWFFSVDEYFEECYNALSRELLVGLYAGSQLLEDGSMVLKDKYIGVFLVGNKSKIQNLLLADANNDTLISCFIEGFFEQLCLYIK